MKKFFSLFLGIGFLFSCVVFPYNAQALGENIKITEIMYDLEGTDTDREWVEIQNVSASSVVLSGWKINDGSNHNLNEPPQNGGQGSLTLLPGEYMIIAHNASVFLSEHQSFSSTVIDSVLALTNTEDTISIINDTGVIEDQVTYSNSIGGAGDGNSLSFFDNGWISATPSPGVASTGVNTSSNGGGTTSTNTSSAGSSVSSIKPKPVFLDSKKEATWSFDISPNVPAVFAGSPFLLNTKLISPTKQQLQSGKFIYTLGDGRVIERTKATPITIEYKEPGTYVLYAEYYPSVLSKEPVVYSRLLINVDSPPVIIDRREEDGLVKILLSNTHSSDMDISSWVIDDGSFAYTFPKKTILPAKRTVTLHGETVPIKGRAISLKSQSGTLVSVYPTKHQTNDTGLDTQIVSSSLLETPPEMPIFESLEHIDDSVFHPYVQKDQTKKTQTTTSSYGIMFLILIVGFIITSSIFVYQKRLMKQSSPQGEVSDEAKEYTIVEKNM